MQRKQPLAISETYHIYNRGAHKAPIFRDDEDYRRFLLLLGLGNSINPILVRDTLVKYRDRFSEIFLSEVPEDPLVDILAYSLMPNHFHLVLRQRTEEGITKFMRRIMVGYSMYFNLKYDHSGVLFQGRFKSTHIDNESYFRYIFAYVHLNPLELVAPDWKKRKISDLRRVRAFMRTFKYSSYWDYCIGQRPERTLLSREEEPDFLSKQNDVEDLLKTFTENRFLYTEIGSLYVDNS